MLPFARMIQYGNMIIPLDIKKVDLTINGCIILTSDGKLYASGTQSAGQFGLGNRTTLTVRTLIAENVVNFWFSQSGLTILKNDSSYWFSGAAYAYGDSGNVFINIDSLIKDKFDNASEIYVARDHATVIVNADGSVWVLGSNLYGMIGLASTTTYAPTWTQNTNLTGVSKMQFGHLNACGIRSNGDVVAWGENRFNCFTTVGGTGYLTPRVVKSNVIDFYLTATSCFMWSDATSVYFSGYTGDTGLLNSAAGSTFQSYNIYSVAQPETYVSSEFRFIKHTNYNYGNAVNLPVYVKFRINGEVYSSGYNLSSSLGVNSVSTSVKNTTLVPGASKMTSWVAGDTNVKLATIDGSLYGAGNVQYILDKPSQEIYPTYQKLNII
ncbi:TPA: hypothetical protein NV758_001595 [Escherichia coli]|uniref:Regulator of chromosome condensation (RCC1) repeat protein n=1 Tax=Escherichia phage vB_Eco_slurp01 TaxID=1874688 RepID=A0A1C3S6E8_9CAUD|nr:hypothetical protein PSLUR01_00140 [Escherichia phage vB_Eco_slurp01]HCJ8661088.1 hypothetical protein [Escherichia coli]HCJ8666580.1 hypothetical protein [Escherichia coli]